MSYCTDSGYIREMKSGSKQDLLSWPAKEDVAFFECREIKHDGSHKIYAFLPNGCTVGGKGIAVTILPWEPFGVAVSKASEFLESKD